MTELATPRGPRNAEVVEAARLHNPRTRRDLGQTLIEGPNLLAEAMSSGVRVGTVFADQDDATSFALGEAHGLKVVPVSATALGRLADTKTPRGPVAVVEIPRHELDLDRNVVVSCGVSEPGNLGTLIRTAAAFGWNFAYTPGSNDPWSPKALRAGAGGQFRTNVVGIPDIASLGPWKTVATVVSGGRAPHTLEDGPFAVLIGSEAHGLSDQIARSADIRLTIPMPGGTESLNASVAAGIAIYALSLG